MTLRGRLQKKADLYHHRPYESLASEWKKSLKSQIFCLICNSPYLDKESVMYLRIDTDLTQTVKNIVLSCFFNS